MTSRLRLAALSLALIAALTAASLVTAQDALRTPLPAPVKAKLGMLNVPALSPLWLLPEYAAKYNVQMEPVMFQRFADARTALASGDLDHHRLRSPGHLAGARPGDQEHGRRGRRGLGQ